MARQIFQIAYTRELMFTREAVLKARGYLVRSALGNDAAKQALNSGGDYQLFMIGHAGSQDVRQEMVQWLRQKFPDAKVLALNPRYISLEPDADYNVTLNGPEDWLAVVRQAIG